MVTPYAGALHRIQLLFPVPSIAPVFSRRLNTSRRLLCTIARPIVFLWHYIWTHISSNIAPYGNNGSSSVKQPQHFTKGLLRTADGDSVDLGSVACSLYPESSGTHHSDAGSACIDFYSTCSENLQEEDTNADVAPYLPVYSPAYLNNPRIKPAMPEAMSRYDMENRKFRYMPVLDSSIDLLKSPLLCKPEAPRGWSELTYTEGGRYFYNKEKKIYTDGDLHNSIVLREVQEVVKIIEDFISANSVVLPASTELALDVVSVTDESVQTTYYFVNHAAKGIFFLDLYEHDGIISSPGQLRQYIESQYWYHVSLYPHSLVLTPSIIKELRDTATYFIADSITSSTSTAPYGEEVLTKILNITSNLDDYTESHPIGLTGFVARFMFLFASSRYLNHAGEAHARLGRDQSIHGQVDYRGTWFLKAFSVLLFSSPHSYYRNMQRIWVDHVVYTEQWATMFRVLNSEWQGYIFLSAILLNANVVFLLVHKWNVYRPTMLNSPIQIANYASITTSLASIVMGLFLMAQTAGKKQVKDANKVQTYIDDRALPLIGLEALAVLYSLPYAFLIWSILYLSLALFLECLRNSSNTASVVVASMAAFIIVVSWWLIIAWPKILRSRPFKRQLKQTSPKEDRPSWSIPSRIKSIYYLLRLPQLSVSEGKSISAA